MTSQFILQRHEVMGVKTSRPLNCPDCDDELEEKIGRLPYQHVSKLSNQKLKTKLGYYYHCPKCNKNYMLTVTLKEVEI